VLRELVPLPQPGPRVLKLRIEGRADLVELELFTKAMALCGREQRPGGSGWLSLDLPPAWQGLPAGLYYLRATARSDRRESHAVCRLLLLR
jgi:hypothetical protein